MDIIEVTGASGAHYRYRLVEVGEPNTPAGGNFLYVGGGVALLAGQTSNLSIGCRERWNEAVENYGAEQLFIRLNVNVAIREQEMADVIASLTPVMNP
ncbi:MAG: hypothetical protein JWM33_1236 [Caulobacteraceae bacterium]|nr:hypothetical protein [Caulobacteraceae bacterium]